MSSIDPITVYHFDPEKLETRAELVYPDSVLDEMARRFAKHIEDEMTQQVLARLGYVKSVRCRDCKRATIDQGDHDYREPLWCGLFHVDVSLDGFCAWGKRKEDE